MKGKIFCLLFAGLICCVVVQGDMNIDAQEKMDIATLKMEWGCLLNTIIADATSRKLEKQANCLDELEPRSGNQTVKNTCEIYDGEKELRVFNYTTKLMLNYASREPRPCFTYGSYSGLCKGVSAIVKKSLVNQTTTCGAITHYFINVICGGKELCSKDEDVKFMEALQTFGQAYIQFLY